MKNIKCRDDFETLSEFLSYALGSTILWMQQEFAANPETGLVVDAGTTPIYNNLVDVYDILRDGEWSDRGIEPSPLIEGTDENS